MKLLVLTYGTFNRCSLDRVSLHWHKVFYCGRTNSMLHPSLHRRGCYGDAGTSFPKDAKHHCTGPSACSWPLAALGTLGTPGRQLLVNCMSIPVCVNCSSILLTTSTKAAHNWNCGYVAGSNSVSTSNHVRLKVLIQAIMLVQSVSVSLTVCIKSASTFNHSLPGHGGKQAENRKMMRKVDD